jgi:broad specificity phosphatase PhoE
MVLWRNVWPFALRAESELRPATDHRFTPEVISVVLLLFTAGMVAGAAALAWLIMAAPGGLGSMLARTARRRLPKTVIIVRHGESEGNIDVTTYRDKADNLVVLTDRGRQQASAAGVRIAKIIGSNARVHMVMSPFERTKQTARHLRAAIEKQIVRTTEDPLIREQEFGNLQGDEFKTFRQEQKRVGRFFYRFPTGESGADVYCRVKQWWDHTMCVINAQPGVPYCDVLVVVTHGLTLRLLLMQLFGWSANTFGTVWNAGNCDCVVLRRDENLPGTTPYALDYEVGDKPRSSIELLVHLADGSTRHLTLQDYLDVPPPRSQHVDVVCRMLCDQHGLREADVSRIDYTDARVRGVHRERRAHRARSVWSQVTWQVAAQTGNATLEEQAPEMAVGGGDVLSTTADWVAENGQPGN